MLRMIPTARRRKAGSALAMALALTGGAAAVTAAVSSPALAQRNGREQQPQPQQQTLSADFQKVYQPVADATNTTGDLAAAKAGIPALLAGVKTPYDRFHAGNILVQLGSKSSDKSLQKQGLELMLASGQASPADAGLFRYFLGGLALDAKDYAGARRELEASLAAGFQGDAAKKQDPWGLIAESYFEEGQTAQGLDYLKGAIAQRTAAGQPVTESWLLRGLKVAYDARLADKATEWSALLVANSPSEQNWMQALQVVNALNNPDRQAELDLLRLMALTNSLKDPKDVAKYIEAADPRIMSNEVARVLDNAVQAGLFTRSDTYYTQVKGVIDPRMQADRAEAPNLAATARKAGSPGTEGLAAGDVFMSLGSYAEAEEMYKLAIERGGIDRDRALTRLGIAQVHQNKLAEARTTFGQVSGNRTAIARMWTAYIESKA